MPEYEFRVLLETISGSTYSYGTGSFVSHSVGTSVVLSTSASENIIQNLPSMSYFNGSTHYTGSQGLYTKGTGTFTNTNIGGNDVDYQFLSSSVKGDNRSGSIIFTANPSPHPDNRDYLKRYKFFGSKVCNVMGIPENYWIYNDAFRLLSSGSEASYLSGDILAQSIDIRDNFAISNAGAITSDLPFKHFKDTDRWIKWTDYSGSIPQIDMLMGYSNHHDRYEIRMQTPPNNPTVSNPLLISSSITSASGDFHIAGDLNAFLPQMITARGQSIQNEGDFNFLVLNAGAVNLSTTGESSNPSQPQHRIVMPFDGYVSKTLLKIDQAVGDVDLKFSISTDGNDNNTPDDTILHGFKQLGNYDTAHTVVETTWGKSNYYFDKGESLYFAIRLPDEPVESANYDATIVLMFDMSS